MKIKLVNPTDARLADIVNQTRKLKRQLSKLDSAYQQRIQEILNENNGAIPANSCEDIIVWETE
jgi:hypothetical protein